MSALLCHSRIGLRDNFFELGGDSLLAIQLVARIEQALGVTLPASVLLNAPNIGDLATLVAQRGVKYGGGVVPLRLCEGGARLFLGHGMDGTVWMYRALARHFPDGYSVFGLEAPVLDGSGRTTIEDLARQHIENIRKTQPTGPYFLGGYSYGGTIAYEIACQLVAAGETVSLLAIFDTSAYDLRSAWSPPEIAYNFLRRVRRRLGSLATRRESIKAYAIDKWELWKMKARTRWRPAGVPSPSEFPKGLAPVRPDAVPTLIRAQTLYVPKPYPGDMVFFRAATQSVTQFDPQSGWGKLVSGQIAVCEVPGDHLSLFGNEANVQALAQALSRFLPAALVAAPAIGP
jgi:thioesterase domain-containing protein/acyl carrier protein